MEDSSLPDHISSTKPTSSYASSPEHSRARRQRPRASESHAENSLPPIRRRDRPGDSTRRGRSQTRSVSPPDERRKNARKARGIRRRSRSPSRENSEGVSESPNIKRRKGLVGNTDLVTKVDGDDSTFAGEENQNPANSRQSSRSRSKRRRRYRRRSDHAANAAEREAELERAGIRRGKENIQQSQGDALAEEDMVVDSDPDLEFQARGSAGLRGDHASDGNNHSLDSKTAKSQVHGTRRGTKR